MKVLPTDLLLGGFTLQTVAVYVKNSKNYFHQLFSEQGENHKVRITGFTQVNVAYTCNFPKSDLVHFA